MLKMKLKSTFLAVLTTSLLCVASALSANAQSDHYLTVPDVQAIGGGTVTVPVSLNNAGGVFSLQIEVFLPDGVEFLSAEGSERIANAEFFDYSKEDKFTEDNQRYRRIIIGNAQNMFESAISGNEGEIIYITFQLPEGEGEYPLQFKNLQFISLTTFALSYMDDVTATINASNYFFTFPEDIQATSGETIVVPLNLYNTGGIYSLQIDLIMPDGVEFIDATLGERVSAEFFNYGSEDKYTDDGLRYRRVIFANLLNTSSTISGNEGVVLYYTLKMPYHVEGTLPLRITNIQFFNPPTYALEYIADAEGSINVTQTPLLVGDVNHDGSVSIADVTALIDVLLGVGNGCEICGDVNESGNLSIADVTALIDKLLGI